MEMLCQVLSLNGGKLRWSGDEYVWKNVSGVSGLVKQQQPGGIEFQTTVQVGGVLLLINVQGFQYPSLSSISLILAAC